MLPRLMNRKPLLASLVVSAAVVSALGQSPGEARLPLLEKLVQDPSPKVRLEALRSLAKIHTPRSAELALGVLSLPMDPTLDYGLWLTINDLSEVWIEALQKGTWKPEGKEKQLEFALRSIKPEQASRVLGQVLAASPLTRDGRGPWIELIGTAGTEKELQALLDVVLKDGFDEPATVRALKSLSDASRLRRIKPTRSATDVFAKLDGTSDPVKIASLQLAAVWKELGVHFPKIGQIASAPTTTPGVRAAAFQALRAIGGKGSLDTLSTLAKGTGNLDARGQAVAALAALDLNLAIGPALSVARALENEAQAVEFWRGILPIKGAGKAIASALHGDPALKVSAAAGRAGMRVAREGGRSDLELVTALAAASGQASDSQAFTGQLVKELASRAAEKGDPARGELIYRRQDLACMGCHAIGGAGGKVGPDMTSIGASAPIDYLVESIVLPNAKIKEGYHSVVVTTKGGDEYTGTLARETTQEVVLRNAAGLEQPIAKGDIASRVNGTLSLMPAGLLEPLNEQEQLDLFAFLSRLGKPGEYDASKGGVARRWYFNVFTHTDKQAARDNDIWAKPLSDKMWAPTYALVSGNLPKNQISEAARQQMWVGTIAISAATEIQVAQAGAVRFKLNAPGAELWVDGNRLGGSGESTAQLNAGTHRVVVRIDPKQVPDVLRLESKDGTFVLN